MPRAPFAPDRRRATLAAVLLAVAGCNTKQPVDGSAKDPSANRPEHRESVRFGYSWVLPQDWKFIPPKPFWTGSAVSSLDAFAAQRQPDGPVVVVLVTDVVSIVPGKLAGDDPRDYDRLAAFGTELLRRAGTRVVGNGRVRMFGLDTVQVTGVGESLRLSVRLLYRGNRRFEFRCFDVTELPEWQCISAFTSFRIQDLPEALTEADVPQVRHLREPQFGVAFDAPDDSWLSIGPRRGGGGAQTVWIWNKDGRQIDIQIMDLSVTPAKLDAAMFATTMGDTYRASGARVVKNECTFAQRRWSHLEVDRTGEKLQDLFFLTEDDLLYGILVTQTVRDPALIEAAKHGFRLVPKAQTLPKP